MFDLVTGKTPHMPGGGSVATMMSSVIHAGVIVTVVTVPLLFAANTLPQVPTMMAFVTAASPPAPAPPPPPPPPRANNAPAKTAASNQNAAPVAAPSHIEPEPAGPIDDDRGAVGGVEGGVSGGVAGGIVGSIGAAAPPPPPPPATTPGEPFRIGGDIKPPTLVRRVEPVYSELALKAHVEGTVILEAIIDENGTVQSAKVLRSVPLLDNSAVAAVTQWRYSPVILNGRPVPVVLTVVFSFKIPVT
jgi:protein TonB